jgi:hypothetical protein
MGKDRPDHHDAELVLRVYELRRETVMRQARHEIISTFWPKTYDELVAVTRPTSPLNTAYRQVGSYWEMVYGMVRQEIVHADYFLESNGEGIYLFARVAPYLERFRAEVSPVAFRNAEWVSRETETGRRFFEVFTARVKKALEAK